MNINEAYIFCEKVANKDQQGLLGPATFTAFAPAAQLDAILVRAPFYGAEQGITDELQPVIASISTPINSTGVLQSNQIPNYLRALAITATDVNYNPVAEIDLLPVDQFRKRQVSKSQYPSQEFAIATMINNGLSIAPKNIGNIIFDYIKIPAAPAWGYTGDSNNPVYNPATSVNFTLPEGTHIELCARILVYAGLHLSDDQLTNWGLARASITSPNAK